MCSNIKGKIVCVCVRLTDWNRNGNWSKLSLISDEVKRGRHDCTVVGIEFKKGI